MNFLKKLGMVVANGAAIAMGFGPIFAATIPSSGGIVREVTDDLTKVSGMIQIVESVGATLTDKNLTGVDKLRAATPLVAQVILNSEVLFDHASGKQAQIADQALFITGCQKMADGMADILNSRK